LGFSGRVETIAALVVKNGKYNKKTSWTDTVGRMENVEEGTLDGAKVVTPYVTDSEDGWKDTKVDRLGEEIWSMICIGNTQGKVFRCHHHIPQRLRTCPSKPASRRAGAGNLGLQVIGWLG
jgi:hypothetical protein